MFYIKYIIFSKFIDPIIFITTLSSTFFILLDELIIGTSQRRIGPFNLGYYGIFSSIVNGCNLIITQFIIPKYHFYFGFQSFPAMLFILCLTSYSIIYPSHTVNLMLSFVLIISQYSLRVAIKIDLNLSNINDNAAKNWTLYTAVEGNATEKALFGILMNYNSHLR